MSPLFKFLFALLYVFAAATVAGQPVVCDLTLSGRVIDDHDRQVLSFAEVWLPEVQRGAITGVDGRFMLEGLCAGTYLVRVTHLGCEPVERRVVLQRSLEVDFRLEHHVEELRELEVVRERPDENVGAAKQELGKDDMERGAGRDMATMLAVIPGVTVLSSGPTIAKPMIQGLTGNRILTLNQGVRQEDQQWGTEHAPNVDPFSSDRITVVKGAASVQYGADAIGGVVITEPVQLPREHGLSGEIRALGIMNGRGGGASGMLQGAVPSVPGLGWRVQGSSRAIGDATAPGYVLSNTGMREAGGSAAVGIRRYWGKAQLYYSYFGRELGILRASHIGNLTDLQTAIATGEPWYQAPFTYAIEAPRQVVQHHLFKAEFEHRIAERNQLTATYGYQADDRQEYDIRRGGRSDRQALDLFLTTHTADVVFKHWLGTKVHGKLGANGVLQDNFNVPGTGIRPLLPDYTRTTGGFFILEHVPLGERYELEVGARLEGTRIEVRRFDREGNFDTPVHSFMNQAVGVGLNWSLSDSTRLRFNLSTAFRPPHVSELYSEGLHHGSAAIEIGDPGLNSENAYRASVDLQAAPFKGRLRMDLTAHAGFFDGYIYLLPTGYQLTIRGAFPVFNYIATDAWLHGLDGLLLFQVKGPWALRSRFSVVRGWDVGTDQWLFQMPSDRIENSVVFQKPELGTWRNMEFTVSSAFVFQQVRYPPDVDFMPPPDTYHLLGMGISIERLMGKDRLRLGLVGGNLLNAAYRDILDRFRYYADSRGADLTLSVRYTFGSAH
ncbi:MAG: TonB-dependent receptor [Flavobacteriales bacterium]|nr:TonB-dependent receptor [Flavobacteriales bacterium]